MITRRQFLISLGACINAPHALGAESRNKPHRIGFLLGNSPDTKLSRAAIEDFRDGLRGLGYVEGKDFTIEARGAGGRYDRYPALTAELVRLEVDVIVTTGGTQAVKAAQSITKTIPIVMTAGSDPVAAGVAASFARPGGNVTGLTNLIADVAPKQVEFLKLAIPTITYGTLLINPTNVGNRFPKNAEGAAATHGIKLVRVEARDTTEIATALAAMARARSQAVIVASDPFFNQQPQLIAELALKYRLPTVTPLRRYVEAGCLMSLGQDLSEIYRRAATYVEKIFKGAKPGDLPIEQPTRVELVFNRKTAQTLGVTIPQELLLRADKVIE